MLLLSTFETLLSNQKSEVSYREQPNGIGSSRLGESHLHLVNRLRKTAEFDHDGPWHIPQIPGLLLMSSYIPFYR